MTTRKIVALAVLAATVAGCTSPQTVTRGAGLDLVRTTAITGTYR